MPNPHGAVPDARYSKKAATNTYISCRKTTVFRTLRELKHLCKQVMTPYHDSKVRTWGPPTSIVCVRLYKKFVALKATGGVRQDSDFVMEVVVEGLSAPVPAYHEHTVCVYYWVLYRHCGLTELLYVVHRISLLLSRRVPWLHSPHHPSSSLRPCDWNLHWCSPPIWN